MSSLNKTESIQKEITSTLGEFGTIQPSPKYRVQVLEVQWCDLDTLKKEISRAIFDEVVYTPNKKIFEKYIASPIWEEWVDAERRSQWLDSTVKEMVKPVLTHLDMPFFHQGCHVSPILIDADKIEMIFYRLGGEDFYSPSTKDCQIGYEIHLSENCISYIGAECLKDPTKRGLFEKMFNAIGIEFYED